VPCDPTALAWPPPRDHCDQDEEGGPYFFDLGLFRSSVTNPHVNGSLLMLGSCVTSTQAILKATLNTTWSKLGATAGRLAFVANQQVSGKGRGGNSWVSPPGCLMCTYMMPLEGLAPHNFVFLQYVYNLIPPAQLSPARSLSYCLCLCLCLLTGTFCRWPLCRR
jgi:hypothetical protein